MAWIGIHASILAGYVLLAVLHTFPLVRHLDTHLPGQGLGDNASFLWNAWWMRVALASPHEFFWSPLIEAPVGGSLALHTHTALSAFLAATVLAPLPLVRAHNLVLLASLALNGLAAYTLAYLVTRARAVSVLAGAMCLVAPAIAVRLMGHYNLVVVWPMLLACAACVAWWNRPTAGRACVFAATAALVPYADYYYAAFLALFAIVYGILDLWTIRVDTRPGTPGPFGRVLLPLAAVSFAIGVVIAVVPTFDLDLGFTTVRVRSAGNVLTAAWTLAIAGLVVRWRPRPSVTSRRRLPPGAVRSLIPAAVVFTLLVSPLLAAAWQLWTLGDYVTQTSSLKSSPRGIDVASLLLGPPFSGLAGPTVRHAYEVAGLDVMEASGWIGVVPLVLLALALTRAGHVADVRRWLIIAGCFGVWALGPYLTVLGRNTGLLLPQALAHVVPILDNARIPGRAMAMVHVAVVVAIGAALSSRAWPRLSAWWLTALGALVIAESAAAPLPLAGLGPPGIYAEIASRPQEGSVLTVPFGVRDGFGQKGLLEHDALYGQTIHGRALVGGFLARVSPRVWAWYESHELYRTLLTASAPGMATAPPARLRRRDGRASRRERALRGALPPRRQRGARGYGRDPPAADPGRGRRATRALRGVAGAAVPGLTLSQPLFDTPSDVFEEALHGVVDRAGQRADDRRDVATLHGVGDGDGIGQQQPDRGDGKRRRDGAEHAENAEANSRESHG